MKAAILILTIISFSLNSQNFSIQKIDTYRNGMPSAMIGKPGEVLSARITFSNSSSSTIKLFLNRYKNELPLYWGLCYCYIQCHTFERDTLTVEVEPSSTNFVVLQFKTDSVNPGIAHASFDISEIGFESNSENVDITAITSNEVGLKELNVRTNLIHLFPNPARNELELLIENKAVINVVKVYTFSGQLIEEIVNLEKSKYTLDLSHYLEGVYFVEVYSAEGVSTKKFIRN